MNMLEINTYTIFSYLVCLMFVCVSTDAKANKNNSNDEFDKTTQISTNISKLKNDFPKILDTGFKIDDLKSLNGSTIPVNASEETDDKDIDTKEKDSPQPETNTQGDPHPEANKNNTNDEFYKTTQISTNITKSMETSTKKLDTLGNNLTSHETDDKDIDTKGKDSPQPDTNTQGDPHPGIDGNVNLEPGTTIGQDNAQPRTTTPVNIDKPEFKENKDNSKPREEVNIKVLSNGDNTPSSAHFMGYFLTAIVLCVAGYVVFHNKQKIIAFIVEGRSGRQRRRGNGSVEYKKLQSNIEEVMPSLDKTTSSKNFIY